MLSSCSSVLSAVVLMSSSAMSMASMNCNHAMPSDGGFAMVIDVCLSEGLNSQMVICHEGQGFLKMWELNRDCAGVHAFEQALSDDEFEVVCDADPCLMAVFEVYDDGSDSSESGESGEESGEWNSTANSTFETTPTSSARRLVRVESSESANSSSCDYSSSTPDIAAIIVDACQATDESESMMITCTGIDDAMVGIFDNDTEHECDGTPTMTMAASEYFAEICGEMVACNVFTEEDFVEVTTSPTGSPSTPTPTPAPTDSAAAAAIFASLLYTFALLLNA